MPEKYPQHYRVTLDRAKQDYQDGLLTATGLVFYAIAILRPPGQKLRVRDDFTDNLGISKRTFYRALSKLKLQNQVEWEPTEMLNVWVTLDKGLVSISDFKMQQLALTPTSQSPESLGQPCHKLGQPCHKLGQPCHKLGQPCHKLGQPCHELGQPCHELGQPCQNQSSKPASSNDSEASPDITDKYKYFLSTLTNEERENFEVFCKEAVSKLPVKPVLTKKWIATYYQELWNQYKGTGKNKEAIEMPNLEQMAKFQELKDAGKIKEIILQPYKNGETISIDTGCAVLFWWEFLDSTFLEG